MAWTRKSGWFGNRFNGSKIPGPRRKPSAKRRRLRTAVPPAETLETRRLLSGTGTAGLIDTDQTIEINGFPPGPGSVSPVGDVNGDGLDDLVVGVGYAEVDGVFSAGQSYVVFGRNDAPDGPIDVKTLDGTNGFVINGPKESAYAGYSVSSAGDFNGDGFDDLIVSAHYQGGAFVVFGRRQFEAALELSAFNGTDGLSIHGGHGGTGHEVAGISDFNGDGLDDVALLRPRVDHVSEFIDGTTITTQIPAGGYVIFGRSDRPDASLDLQSMTDADGVEFKGGDHLGTASLEWMADGGDLNGDGLADLVIHSLFRPKTVNSGEVFVVYGREDASEAILFDSPNGTDGFRVTGSVNGQALGRWAGSAGDINADGIDDLILSSNRSPIDPQRDSLVIYGTTAGMPAELSDTDIDGSNGFLIEATSESEYWYFVDGVGDFDGDGISDFSTQENIVFGTDAGFPVDSDGTLSESAEKFSLRGTTDVAPSRIWSLRTLSAGDFNGDGFDDVVVSEPIDYATTGSMFVVFGRGPDGEFRSGETRTGPDSRDVFSTSSSTVDVVVGGQANDTLTSGFGPDVLYGGEGDDRLVSRDLAFRRISGGSGFDTVDFSRISASIDLTVIPDSRLTDIEAIDLFDEEVDTLIIDRLEVLNLSSTSNTVRVFKDTDDVVDMGDGWEQQATIVDDWRAFEVYTQGEARLELQVPIPSILDTINAGGGIHFAAGDDDRYFGRDIHNTGDINGDGFDDLLIKSQPSSASATGTAFYVVFGSDEAFSAPFVPATDLDGTNGFKVSAGPSDNRVVSIVPVGDFNADGYADLIVTTADTSTVSETVTSVIRHSLHVVLGQSDPFVADLNMGQLDGSNGFTLHIDTDSIMRGFNPSSPGDINGDGFEDVLFTGRLQSPEDFAANRDGTAVAYVLFGRSAENFESFTLDDFDSTHGVRIDADEYLHLFSRKESNVERVDINGDGFDDLALGAWRYQEVDYSLNRINHEFVVFGREDWPERIEVADWEGASKFEIELSDAGRKLGDFLPVSDVTGDGIDDFIAATYGAGGYPLLLHTIFGSEEPLAEVQILSMADSRDLVVGHASQNLDFDFNADGWNDGVRAAYIDGEFVWGIVLGSSNDLASDAAGDGLDFSLANGFAPRDVSEHDVIFLVAGEDGIRDLADIGDINGDGYDDVAFTDSSDSSVHVLFGRPAIVEGGLIQGTVNDDSLSLSGGSEVAEAIVGLQGNDTLTGDGGPDAFAGGAGDDVIRVADDGFLAVDGGYGFDTLVADGAGVNLDLTASVSRLRDLEAIDFRNGSVDTLTLDLTAVRDLSSTSNTLRIYKDAADVVETGNGWTASGAMTIEGLAFTVLRYGGATIELQDPPPPQLVDRTIQFEARPGASEHVTVSLEAETNEVILRVEIEGMVADEYRFPHADVSGVRLNLGDGDDVATVLTSDIAVTISGGEGQDRIDWNGSDLSDHLTIAQSAGDVVTVSAMLEGDIIREMALFDGVEHFGMELQGGDDSVQIEAFAEPGSLESVRAFLGAGNDRFDSALADVPVIVLGNAGDDTLITGSGNDILNGGSGDDSLGAGAGNDALLGGNGDDEMLGGDGNDRLRGHGGIDTLDGAEGVDMLDGGRHRTHLRDQVSGRVELTNAGYATENGDQAMSGGGFSTVSLSGGDGNDELDASAFTDGAATLNGGEGNDNLTGTTRHLIIGGAGYGDRLSVGGPEAGRVNIGAGAESVSLLGAGQSLDFSDGTRRLPSRYGKIDIRGTGSNSLRLDRSSFSDPTETSELTIYRDADDQIDIGDEWEFLEYAFPPAGGVTALLVQDDDYLAVQVEDVPQWRDGVFAFTDEVGVSNDVTIRQDPTTGQIIVDLNGDLPDTPARFAQWYFDVNDVVGISLDLGAGNDRVTLEGLKVPVTIVGGAGVDTLKLVGSDDGESFIWSSDGDGELSIRQSSEFRHESMLLNAPGIERVEIDARGGDDRVLADADSASPVSVTRAMINLGAGNDLFQLLDYSFAMNVNGSAGDDEIITGAADDTLIGGGGNDHLVGGSGNDRIRGQGGVDLIAGGKGIDTLDGGGGVTDLFDDIDGRVELTDSGYETGDGDTARSAGGIRRVFLRGGDGDDVLSASQFTGRNVTLAGGAGNDVLLGSRHDDVLLGEAGNDSLLGAMGHDLMHGGDGDDRLRGHGGHDFLVGGIGNDFLDGATGHDRLAGEEGDDTLIGMNGEDTLSGGTGDDSLDGGGGATTLREEANVDMVLATRDGQTVLEGLGVDTIVGRVTAATLIGGDTANRLDASGFAGQVALYGGMGNDTLIGTRGNDTIDGGAARDSIEAGAGDDIVLGGFGNDRVFGGVGSDTLLGGKGNDILNGAGGSDVVLGEKGDDTVHGGDATDQVAGGGNGFAPAAGDVISDVAAEIDETLKFDVSDLNQSFDG